MKIHVLLGLTTILSVINANAADHYKVDPAHSTVAFSIRHMGISNVKGHFDEFAGSVDLENGAIQSAEGTVQIKSINTGITQRDKHLQTKDFFDATNYPQIVFKTQKVEQSGGQTVVIADFAMRGVTNQLRMPVTLTGPVKDMQGKQRIGIEAKTVINRKDYGIAYDKKTQSGSAMIGDEVTLEINAEAVELAEAAK